MSGLCSASLPRRDRRSPHEHLYQAGRGATILPPIDISNSAPSRHYATRCTGGLAIEKRLNHNQLSLKLPSIKDLGLLNYVEDYVHEQVKMYPGQGSIHLHRHKQRRTPLSAELPVGDMNPGKVSLVPDKNIACQGSESGVSLSIVRDGCAISKMTQGWAKEEITQLRRIVRFYCYYRDTNCIRVGILPVSGHQETASSMCVSCIYWHSRGDYFITSVDIIRLLQYLLQRSIPPAERSRIRQNLKTIRSRVVSRHEQETSQLAETIEAFEYPKAIGAPKAIKIFHWKDLEFALTRICKNYSVRPHFSMMHGMEKLLVSTPS
ncbi:hypothetical protein ETB97_009018 [Aspergillus alliaceus]|uniref:DUF7082 domain-containing protein n=1 Tax=Petromyces alliaceus TaxID=209559 RepID=A0A8H6E924_PETAA|nr:hypothetical protein ETB97_009018 [Aspergillus burnettii]